MNLMKYAPWLVLLAIVGSDKPSGTEHQQSYTKQPYGGTAAQSEQSDAKIYSPDCKKPKDHPEADLCVQRRMADAAEWQNWINSWGLGGLIATFVATGIAAVAAAFQARLTRLGLIHTQRAFVFIKEIDTFSFPDRPLMKIMPKWENSGQTPTKRMVNHVNWKFFEGDIPADYDFPDLPGEPSVPILLGPGGNVFTSSLDIATPFLERVIRGEGRIYLWGWADYDDVFAKTPRHRTEFCNEMVALQLAPDKADGSQKAALQFRMHRAHNGTDEQCMKKPKPYLF